MRAWFCYAIFIFFGALACRGTRIPLEERIREAAVSRDPGKRMEALWALYDPRGNVVVAAARGLAEVGDKRAIPHLLSRIRDPSVAPGTRLKLLDTLFSFPPGAWMLQLKAMAPSLSPGILKDAAAEVLECYTVGNE